MATQPKSKFSRVELAVKPPLGRIQLSHPPQNVIDLAMMDELLEAWEQVEARPDIPMAIFSGGAKTFSAGVDVAAHTPQSVEQMLAKFHRIIRALVSTRKVTIAAVWGNCLGGGAELALVCDMVITSKSAVWGFPEIKLACYPPVACVALAAAVGQKRAAELVLTGRTFSGEEAAAIGLANVAVDDSEVEPRVDETAQALAQLSPAALAHAKKALSAWDAIHFEKGLARAEQIYLDELMKTTDASEGIAAWLLKRPPIWRGR